MEVLESSLQKLEGMGRDIYRKVPVGGFEFTLFPLSSSEEVDVYIWAQEQAGFDPDGKSAQFKVSPAYVHLVRQKVVARAIKEVDGVVLPFDEVVHDRAGDKREVGSYLLKIVMSWPSEIVEFLFVEYNKLQIEVSKKCSFSLTHRAVLSLLDEVLRVSSAAAEAVSSLSKEGEDALEEEIESNDPSKPGEVPKSEDPSPTGVLDQDGTN